MGVVSLRKQADFLKQISKDKKRGHMPPFLFLQLKSLSQQDTAILNKEWREYQAQNR